MTEQKLIKEKVEEDGTIKHTSEQKFKEDDLVQIFTAGIEDIPVGKVLAVIEKSSKFVGTYYLYNVEYTLGNKTEVDLFYPNELYPIDEVITKKKRKKNYINNRDFFKALVQWKAKREENPSLPIPKYIGECFIKLVNNVAKQGYHSHIDDMKAEALMLCCRYAHNFDPEESINAFAYFTRYVKNAFAYVHNNEKKQIDGKFQYIKQQYCDHPEYDYRMYDEEGESE